MALIYYEIELSFDDFYNAFHHLVLLLALVFLLGQKQ